MTSIIVALSIALVLVTVCAVVVVAFFLRMCREREAAAQQTMESLEARFSSLAAQELQGKSRAFLEQNRDSLAEITGNLRSELLRSMAELRLATESATRTNAEIGSVMRSQVDGVRQSAEALGRKAEGLERALSGGGKVQGIWGESVLAMVLKSSGLREDVDYFLQKGTHGAGIPDAEVIDPQGRVLVIDSKTSLTAFINSRRVRRSRPPAWGTTTTGYSSKVHRVVCALIVLAYVKAPFSMCIPVLLSDRAFITYCAATIYNYFKK